RDQLNAEAARDPSLAFERDATGWNWDCVSFMVDARSDHTNPTEAEIDRACPDNDIVLTYFGYLDATFRAIEKRYSPPDSIPDYARLFMPHMRPVRGDARFMTQAARLGLADYWLETGHWPDFCREEKLPYDCKEAALAQRAA